MWGKVLSLIHIQMCIRDSTKAANNSQGVAAEKAWIAWKYPSAKIEAQAVSGAKNKTFDNLEIKTVSGETKTLCFDITDFFGRW